jgi:hypothetical protein
MKRRRHTPEQIVRKLREADRLLAEGLIAACLERCREHGATRLVWQTATDNHRAQAVMRGSGPPR